MRTIRVETQEALDAALRDRRPGDEIACVGSGEFGIGGSATVRAWDSATVRAWDSATVRAWDSATVRAWDSATVRASGSATVRAWDSATVTAWDSATVRASGSATVRASGSATVTAGRLVAVVRHLGRISPTVEGGVLIDIPRPRTAEEWCELHDVEVVDGVAVLFKALDADFCTPRSRDAGISYAPGSTPEAPDWDGGVAECGGGLHFVAHPWEGLRYHPEATRFAACPVALADIAVHEDAGDPSKIKARRVCAPTWEVTIDGARIEPAGEAAAA